MGYRTVQHVSGARTYTQALAIYNSIKPIRGRVPEKRPLGNRRDCDTYWCRMTEGLVEFMVYNTPVVAYFPDGRIHIKDGGWQTQTTNQFFYQVLGIHARVQSGKTIVSLSSGSYELGDGLWIRTDGTRCDLAEGEADKLPKAFKYKVNRKKMNECRSKYRAFEKYMESFISLRSIDEAEAIPLGYGRFNETVLTFTHDEVKDAVGEFTNRFRRLEERPQEWRNRFGVNRENIATEYKERGEELMRWMSSSDTADHYKAIMGLMGACDGRSHAWDGHRPVRVSWLRNMYNRITLRWHAEEVIEKEELGTGCISNGKYANWF